MTDCCRPSEPILREWSGSKKDCAGYGIAFRSRLFNLQSRAVVVPILLGSDINDCGVDACEDASAALKEATRGKLVL